MKSISILNMIVQFIQGKLDWINWSRLRVACPVSMNILFQKNSWKMDYLILLLNVT